MYHHRMKNFIQLKQWSGLTCVTERPRIAYKTNSNTKHTSDTSNESKGAVLTTTSVTKIDTVTNKNSKNKPCNGIKTEHRKLMTEDKEKRGDNGR